MINSIETLENRRLFSVTVSWSGSVSVVGDSASDDITVHIDMQSVDANIITVDWLDSLGHAHHEVDPNNQTFDTLEVHGGGGDDGIVITTSSEGSMYSISVFGDAGPDIITAAQYSDYATDGNGNQTVGVSLVGGDGDDFLGGSVGPDTISGDGGNDTILADEGNDSINGGVGNDTIYGNQGDDTISGGDGSNLLEGDDGNDDLWSWNLASDIVDGGNGDDTAWIDTGLDTTNACERVYDGSFL